MRFMCSLRAAFKALLCMVLLAGGMAFAQVGPPTDPSLFDEDETAVAAGMVKNITPLTPAQPWLMWGSEMQFAAQHDARWASAAATHATGANARIVAMLAKGNTFFVKTGDTFGKILAAYQEISKAAELYQTMKQSWEFVKHYQLKVNLYRFLPVLSVDAPDEMGGGLAFAVGIFPKDSTGWEARNNLLNDNPWKRPPTGLRVVSVRYPHSLNDLVLDASIWGSGSLDEEEFQKVLLAGMYDGVMSAGAWMTNAGIGNNLADNVANMGPKAFARRISTIVARRIADLQAQRDMLYGVSTGAVNMPAGMSPEGVLEMIAKIDLEIERLKEKDTLGYASSQMADSQWMRQAAYVNEILAKLEQKDRRLALMKLRERYKKYEAFWANPDMMNPTPDITGNPKVDAAINLIWNALTVLSKGKIPPPVPVAGGEAAKAQATMVRSMYREFMVDELRAVRRLLAFRYTTDKQAEAAQEVAEDGRQEVDRMMAVLAARADHIKRLRAYAEARKAIEKQGDDWVFGLSMI